MKAVKETKDVVNQLPLILAGPILRHCDETHFTLWFVSKVPLNRLNLILKNAAFKRTLNKNEIYCIKLGEHAYQYLITLNEDNLLPNHTFISYQLTDSQHGSLFDNISGLNYSINGSPNVVIKPNIDNLLHGSCRNPHHFSDDGLVTADHHLENNNEIEKRPALLMLSGDQVYVDDIAGPMLFAIGKVIQLLGLNEEAFIDGTVPSSKSFNYNPCDMYQRHSLLLPKTQYKAKTAITRWYINHPIFTSSIAENHLISLAEIMGLYLLTWSPELWHFIDIPVENTGLSPINQQRWAEEHKHIKQFVAGLPNVRRLLAHLPTYMIFDDHDITDDWNLTAKWELAAYEHAFSKRIIGNALIGYTLFQGLGNAPDKFTADIIPLLNQYFSAPNSDHQDSLITALLKFENWHYTLNTSPKLVVLDTRTRRWRSESNLGKPSGLMDWEALMELQQALINQSKVIIVSAAPMFGVKLIETVQRVATLCGGSLLVDAENWMAHPGTANSLLSIFQHKKTPEQFIVLSGDVHYSFSYDIHLRFRQGGPDIYQITCSGIKNQFPDKLLTCFDKLNGWLYGHFSPLNLLTKRKRLSIRGRRPNGHSSQRLVNNSGIGYLALDEKGAPTQISVLHGDMSSTDFHPPRQHRQEIKDIL
ncbi:alkaline phosphatase D family protein [Shewanella surugensis]|uniref:Alkaline phosphatase family protein n=1 Tax=Shewanella surugensis TaxID=212020 RepID=A0ABT0LCJ2_9GAMM|nr:alkaline phosphatase D family protein [Shewanella surugensis]MCL1125426.1 alkaline phosphatase family protein [Shewanella surugensis]